jgi:hypothetical protein
MALPLYRGVALVIAAPLLYRRLCAGHRRTALVSAAMRWSSPHRPCIGGSALVIGGAAVYRGLCVVEKCQIFLQGIKRSESMENHYEHGRIENNIALSAIRG